MLKFCVIAAVMVAMAMPAFAAKKIQGTTKLKDSEPVGMPNKKQKQRQAYDLTFDAAGNAYTCRTDASKSMNATDFVVGSMVTYEIDGQKAKIRTAAGKKVQCSIVRVEAVGETEPPSPQ
ncbi:MAG TPA: hypothetical protein VME86_00075 [Acidobacteriaceae bacterium]|nr:hypothetical protein [Acidobacteriaceae bacterium]